MEAVIERQHDERIREITQAKRNQSVKPKEMVTRQQTEHCGK